MKLSGSQSIGQVLGITSTAAGAAILPVTGGSTIGFILPVVAIACGIIILVSLSLTSLLEKKD